MMAFIDLLYENSFTFWSSVSTTMHLILAAKDQVIFWDSTYVPEKHSFLYNQPRAESDK